MDILLVIHIIIVVCLIGVILMQRSATDGFTGAGGGNSLMSGRASASFMSRATALLATAFIINSLVLAYMSSNSEESSLIESIVEEDKEKVSVGMDDLQENLDETGDTADDAQDVEELKGKLLDSTPDIPESKTTPIVPLAE